MSHQGFYRPEIFKQFNEDFNKMVEIHDANIEYWTLARGEINGIITELGINHNYHAYKEYNNKY